MSLASMKVFQETVRRETIETVAQMVEKFNAASNGAIQLTTQGFEGDYLMESMFQSLGTAQRRVDRYANNTTVNPTPLQQIQQNSVKVGGGFGPVIWEPSQMTWVQQNPQLAVEMASRNLAEYITKDQLNTAINAAVAAVFNQGSLAAGGTTNPVDYSVINNSHSKFGDHSQNLIAQVMDGETYHKLIGININNQNTLFQAGNVLVVDMLGKPVIVTDAPALTSKLGSNTTATNQVLSLVNGGIIVHDGDSLVVNVETSNGKERIESTFQADYDFGLGLKGYAWDTANGGKSPTNTEIGTGTNWDMYVTDVKHTAGVLAYGKA